MKKHIGATLLELMLVLSVASLIVIASLRLVRLHEFELTVQKLKESLNISLLLANQYYFGNDGVATTAHCHDPTVLLTKHMSDLQSWGVTTASFSSKELEQIVNPLGGAIEVSYLQWPVMQTAPPTPYVYLIQLSASFNDPQKLRVLQAELNADDTIVGNTLTWTRLPLQKIEAGSDPLWVASKSQWVKLSTQDPLYSSACPK